MKTKKYATGGEMSPNEIVADIDRRQNEEDLDLVPRAGRMIRNKLNEDLTGGAYVGNRLNMGKDRGSRLGRVSKEDSDMIMRQDAKSGMNRNPRMGGLQGVGMKKGGKVKKFEAGGMASDGIGDVMSNRTFYKEANKDMLTKPKDERQKLAHQKADEARDEVRRESNRGISPENRKATGGSVKSASSRADGCVTKGKTKGRFV